MAKKRVLRTEELFAETEEVAAALIGQTDAGPQYVPIDRLVPNRFNPRHTYELGAHRELTRSIREHGFIGSLDGRRLADGRVELAYGSRRLLAARDAGVRSIPVALHEWTDAQMCFVSLAENLAREDLTADDETEIIREMRDALGLDCEVVARRAGRPSSWVDQRLASVDGPAMSEQDAASARLDEVVASIVGDADQEPTAPVYGLDVERDADLRPIEAAGPVRRDARAAATAGASGRSWVETGSTMLILAMDLLGSFEPGAVSDDELGEALDWLSRLDQQIALFREELKARQ